MKIVIYIILLISQTINAGLNLWNLRRFIEREESKSINKHFSKNIPYAFFNTHITEDYVEQPLDHFEPRLKETFWQRYFTNSQFWKNSSGPIFLYISGEGRNQIKTVLEGALFEYASEHSALIISAEHRFYGSSLNSDSLGRQNLQYLSSQQALADLAWLSKHISKRFNLTDANKWISFGGSYAGALSAWLRLKYPHIVSGAIASSAPVRALTNFIDYNNVVRKSLATPVVGGSQKCMKAVESAFSKIETLVKSSQLAKLADDFKSCQPLSASMLDLNQFVSNVADIFQDSVQYNNESPLRFNISGICTDFVALTDPYEALVALNKKFLIRIGKNCSDNSWKSYVEQMMDDQVNVSDNNNSMRPWTYQTCTQFGYYQTCESNSSCIFSKLMPLAPNLELCRILFDMSPKDVYDSVDFTNAYYGSDRIASSNIVFVNGLIDPWHALGVLNDLGSSEKAIVIPETAHCADLHASSPEDPSTLTDARKKINSKLIEWLS